MSDDGRRESVDEEGKTEAQLKMEADMKRRSEKDEAEWKEYEEMRKAEREKEEQEIRELRERRERRKKERAEEERRLAELRVVEEQKKRAEEEERQRKRREEEAARREEREKRRMEHEERSKNTNRPNFVINKKSGESKTEGEQEADKKPAKTKEQLEAEKKAALEQRVQPLNVAGLNEAQLKEKAKEIHNMIYRLESEKYDLTQQFQRQNMDLMELAERARQMSKGGQGKKVNMSQTDAMSSTMSRAPPKIAMYSQYERVKDPRSFNDRQTVFVGPMYGTEYERVVPKSRVEIGDQGAYVVGEYEEEDNQQNNALPAEVAAA